MQSAPAEKLELKMPQDRRFKKIVEDWTQRNSIPPMLKNLAEEENTVFAQIKYEGKLVEDGFLDARKSGEILIGIDELTAVVKRSGQEQWQVYGQAKLHTLKGLPEKQLTHGQVIKF